MNIKLLKKIIILLIIVIILIITIIFINNKNNNIDRDNNSIISSENIIEEDTGLKGERYANTNSDKKEVDNKVFFTIANCIPRYLDMTIIGGILSEEQKADNIICLLSDNVKINKNINKSNVLNKINKIDQKYLLTIIEISNLIEGTVDSYSVHAMASDLNYNYLGDLYFIVNLDKINNTFSIEQLEDEYYDINKISTVKVDSIQKNNYNQFEYQSVDIELLFKKYIEYYKRIILAKPELAYEYLDDDYKNKRFGSYDYFKNYVQENRETIEKINPQKFKANDDNTEVIITDQSKNRITFEVTGVMKFKVKLDNYIILGEDDINIYNDLEEREKIKYNINRWIKMINGKDYKYAYEYLDETFKDEKFGSEDSFEQFMKEKYPEHYEYSIKNLEENGDVYTAEIEFNVEDEEFSEKYMTIIMKLGDGTEFSMSFDNQ